MDGFERFFCVAHYNPFLTVKIIWDSFLAKVKSSLEDREYILQDNAFNRCIEFIISRYPEGNQVIAMEPYYLKAEKKFGFLVNFRFRRNEGIEYNARVQQLSLSIKSNLRSNIDYYADKLDKIYYFIQKYKDKLFPITIDGESIDIENNLLSMHSHSLDIKRYIFREDQESNSQFQGVKAYGPLFAVQKEPLYIFIFQPSQRVQANELFSAMVGKSYPETFPGLQAMFGLPMSKHNIVQINISSLTKEGMQNVDHELNKIIEEHRSKAIIGIFIINEKDKPVTTHFSPYHFLKLIFTNKRIPLQVVRFEKIMGRDGLKWSIANISLQLFAKLGGTPWKVKPSNERCLIFGLGSAHKKGKDGKIHKYFAYSVCLDSSGLYRSINVLGKSEDRKTYINQLRENIKAVIKENLDEHIDKCALHLPFKIKNDEMEFIKSGVKQLSLERKDIEFQFIKINTRNKFFGFAENNSKVPYESNYIQLSQNEFLIWFEGLQYGKENVKRRIGNPVHIEFLQMGELDNEKRRKYLQDIINLSGANWRGFNSKLSPISIFYPSLIAEFIAEFYELTDEEIDFKDFYIPWFL
jgi:hypothetical protein